MGRFGHCEEPVADFCREVALIEAAVAKTGPTDELLDRVNRALHPVWLSDDAVAAKQRLQRVADVFRQELGIFDRGAGKVALRAPNGATWHMSLEGDDLWIHVEASPGHSARCDFEANCGNEGWLRLRQIVPAPQPALRRNTRRVP